MLMRIAPRSRQETRAMVLEYIFRENGSFRPPIARNANLTEASVSRILSELHSEGIVDESRKKAPYVGGPSTFVTLSKSISIAGIELTDNRLSFGVGDLHGAIHYVERIHLDSPLDQSGFERLFTSCLASMQRWMSTQEIEIRQAALSLPGYNGFDSNPIFPWDMERLHRFLSGALGQIPIALTNSVVAQAAFHRYLPGSCSELENHLFLFVGHGVAGVVVQETMSADAFSPIELGHMVIERGGLRCRCGHHGCLEAYTSLPAIANILGVPENEILSQDPQFVKQIRDPSAETRMKLRERLVMLGVGIGNVINLHPLRSVAIGGWPSLLEAEDRLFVGQGINESLLGGFDKDRLRLDFIVPEIGNDPQVALRYAAYCFVRDGASGQNSSARAAAEGAA